MCVFSLSSWWVRPELYPFDSYLQRTSFCLGFVDFVWELESFPFHWYLPWYYFLSCLLYISLLFFALFSVEEAYSLEISLIFQHMTLSTINSPKHCLSINFCQRTFSSHLVQTIWKFLLRLLLWPSCYSEVYFSTSSYWGIFQDFFQLLISSLISQRSESSCCITSALFSVLGCVLWPSMWCLLLNVPGELEKTVCPAREPVLQETWIPCVPFSVSWGPSFALCPALSYGSQKSSWFFSLFRLLRVLRMER